MTSQRLAELIARIRETDNYVDLTELAHEIAEKGKDDEAVPRLVAMIVSKQARLARQN